MGADGGRVYDENVTRRVVFLLVAVGFLSGVGMPLSRPCCTLAKLSSTISSPDCCPMPDCCRGEKRGAAPMVLSARLDRAAALPSLSPSFVGTPTFARPSFRIDGFVDAIASLHGPPEPTRRLSLLLSTLRV